MAPRSLPLLAACVLLFACRSPASEATRGPDAAGDELRESARALLETNCGECHTRASPQALPRALRVYDLDEEDFARRMTGDQLREAERRLREPFAPTPGEGDARPVTATPGQLERFHRFVEREVARRDGA